MIRAIFTAFVLCFPLAVFAGGFDHENGGIFLRCEGGPKGPALTLLDLYEGERLGLTMRTLRSFRGRSLEEAFPAAVSRFLRRNRDLADLFLRWFDRRDREILFVTSLPRIQSRSWTFLPSRCRRQQAAVQIISGRSLSSPHRILVDRDLWHGSPAGGRGLSTDLKIALLFHEYILRWRLLVEGQCAHASIRQITAFVLSDQALAESRENWHEGVSDDRYPWSLSCALNMPKF